MRREVLTLLLVLLAILIVASIVGAFAGVDSESAMAKRLGSTAPELFNSRPAVAFWLLFALLLAIGLAVFPRLVRSPGRLALHLGPLLILVGAMWGSVAGHNVANAVLGTHKAPRGYMVIGEGEADGTVYADQTFNPQKVATRLPFSLFLKDFRIEYYGDPWDLVVVAPPSEAQIQAMGQNAEPREQRFDWSAGSESAIPFTDAKVKVLRYIEHARLVYPEGESGVLRVATADGKTLTLPPEAGREAALEKPRVTLRITRIFGNLKVTGSGADRQIVDAGGSSENPALEVQVVMPDGKTDTRYIMALFPMHGQKDDGLTLTYEVPKANAAEPDPAGLSPVPAMQVEVTASGKEMGGWFLPRPEDSFAWLSLAPVLGPGEPTAEGAHAHGLTAPRLYLARPMGAIKDFLSDLQVIDEGRQVLEQTVEVNKPLHFGGYHFYQHNYDQKAGRYTILSVTSDSGLLLVYAGFFLVVAGSFCQGWLLPVWNFFARRRPHAGR